MTSNVKRFRFSRYFAYSKASFQESLAFRMGFLISIVGSIVYTIVICYLWKAIFQSAGAEVVNGMTYNDTLVYLALAGTITASVDVFLVWDIGRAIQTGDIALAFVRPADYFTMHLFTCCTSIVISFVVNVIPIFFLIEFISGWAIPIGFNIVFFMLSLFLGIIINFCIDFIVGNICFYTQSIWGINIMKEVVVHLLSGATIPLAFFPDKLHDAMMFLPFQAIYHTPLTMLINESMPTETYLRMFGVQLVWVVVLVIAAKLFFRRSSRVVTVNGG